MARTRRGEGQTALVTGASAGIGVDLAECFAEDGYNLILTARTESALREVADRLAKTYAIAAVPIAADLAAIGGGAGVAGGSKEKGVSGGGGGKKTGQRQGGGIQRGGAGGQTRARQLYERGAGGR